MLIGAEVKVTNIISEIFHGLIDEVRIYNRALSQNEIQELADIPPSIVNVDDDFDSSTPGWGYDHFSSIQDGIDAVDVGGTVYVASGTYNQPFMIPKSAYLYIDKSIKLIGENEDTTIINCPDQGNSGGESGKSDLQDAVTAAVINKRSGGMGLILGRKAFKKPTPEGIKILNAVQDVYLNKDITIA